MTEIDGVDDTWIIHALGKTTGCADEEDIDLGLDEMKKLGRY